MKKILLAIAVVGVLASCGTKDESVKTESVKTTVVTPQKEVVAPEESALETPKTLEDKEAPKVEESKPTISKPKNHMSKVNKTIKKSVEPAKVEDKVAPTPVVVTETSVDKVVDNDVDKKITEIEIDSKKVETKPVKDEKSNKTLYGAIAAIVVAAGAVVAFKRK